MRKKIIAGNWKMNTTIDSGIELIQEINTLVQKVNFDQEKIKVIVAPPFTHLHPISKILIPKIKLAAQDISKQTKGAFTGEISAEMIQNAGAKYSIIGHSERRTYFKENSETLTQKVNTALKYNIKPIFCVGETLQDRKNGTQNKIIKTQIQDVLFKLNQNEFEKIIIAYEPVWAIGTGLTATPEQAQEIHKYIRELIKIKFSTKIAENTTILYGGSCKPNNANGLFTQPDIDGGLIGGAALKANDFLELITQLITTIH